MSISPKAIYRVNVIPIKIPMTFFTETEEQKNTKICMEPQKVPNSQSNPEGNMGETKLKYHSLWFQIILQSHSNQKSMVSSKWHTNQWNRIESSEINTHIYRQLIHNTREKNIQWRIDSLFNKWCWKNWSCKRMKLDHQLTPYTKSIQNGLRTWM